MEIVLNIVSVILAYLVGSIPTGLLYSRWFQRSGKVPTRAKPRQFAFGAGLGVVLIEIIKGMAAVWLTMMLRRSADWQMISGAMAILGHNFSIFDHFRGGQGLAVTVGVLLVFFPVETFFGAVVYVILFLIFKNSNLAAAAGGGTVIIQQILNHESFSLIGFTILLLCFTLIRGRLKPIQSKKVHAGKKQSRRMKSR